MRTLQNGLQFFVRFLVGLTLKRDAPLNFDPPPSTKPEIVGRFVYGGGRKQSTGVGASGVRATHRVELRVVFDGGDWTY